LSPTWARELLMATNAKPPDFPDIPRRKSENEHAKVQIIRKSKFPWPILILIGGAALLIAIFALLPKAPHLTKPPTGAQVPQQPTAEQVQLTNLKLAPAPVGGAAYLTGILHNTGSTAITGVQVQAEFLGRNGPVLSTLTVPVQGLTDRTAPQDLTKAPIQPNESRPIRIYFEHTPAGWNHQLPNLTVTTVTGTTA
jgi:Protein of unknown function (DUF3426)